MKKVVLLVLVIVLCFMNATLISINTSNNFKIETEESTKSTSIRSNRNAKRTIENTVRFDFNGGKFEGTKPDYTVIVEFGSLLTEPDRTKFSRKNSKFLGWYTADNIEWDFAKDIITEDVTLQAKWKWDNSHRIEDEWSSIENYFKEKYYSSSNWHCVYKKSMEEVAGYIPIEVSGNDENPFPKSDILTAIETSNIASSYGGCGPIAMIGIMDYFARFQGFASIMDDPTNSKDRINLAYEIFKNTKTYEMPPVSSSEKEKNTFTYPNDYVDSFNTLMERKYHLNEQIVAYSQGILASFNSKVNRVKQSIDEGLPVTIYAGLAGSGKFANHYVNAYEYEIWQGLDRAGNVIENTIFSVRYNGGWSQSAPMHMDADLLSESLSGVIYYTVKDKNQLIRPINFAKDFVNDSGQGQYFFYEKDADITTENGFKFGTSRLRCGYIEDKYLVLSANREGAGTAYLEMQFDIDVKAVNFDISLWSGKEILPLLDSYVKLQYLDSNGIWQDQIVFEIHRLSTLKDIPDNFYTTFPETTFGVRFIVHTDSPTSDRNNGRVVLGNMNLFY